MIQLSPSNGKTALVLAGGGLTGAVYELGALRAIDDLLIGRTVNDFDIYVGTSAGAIVCTGLVSGITPQTMLRSVEGSHTHLPDLQRHDLFRFNTHGAWQKVWQLPHTLWSAAKHYQKYPSDLNLYDFFWEIADSLPPALYDSMALEGYVRRLIAQSGYPNDFSALEKQLYIIATSLETGERAVFGDHPYRDLPISLAVTASSAVPIIYKPVRIGDDEFLDGGLRGTASLDIAIEKGAKLIICINPIVPYDNSRHHHSRGFLSEHGMQAVIDQTFRIVLHSGLNYHIKQLRRTHPDVDIILIEPRIDDEAMIFSNIMRHSARLRVAKHGYESVTMGLESEYHHLKQTLGRHGVEISRSKKVVGQLQRMHTTSEDDVMAIEDVLELPHKTSTASSFAAIKQAIHDLM